MSHRRFFRALAVAAMFGIAFAGVASAQQNPAAAARAAEPSPAKMAMARELLGLLGHMAVPETAMLGAIEGPRNVLIQGNPTLDRPLKEVTVALIAEMRPRVEELRQIMARAYAEQYTDQEFKEILTFLKTPTGKKFASSDTKIVQDKVYGQVDAWLSKFATEVTEKIRAEMRRKGYNML